MVGIVGLLVLAFFSSTAFTVIERAMAIIFYHRSVTQHRHFVVSVLLPYLFMMLIGVGLLLITVISSALPTVRAARVFGPTWPAAGLPGAVLYLMGVVGLALLLTAFYMVLPVGQIRFGHALAGGCHRDRALGGDPPCHGVVLRRGHPALPSRGDRGDRPRSSGTDA